MNVEPEQDLRPLHRTLQFPDAHLYIFFWHSFSPLQCMSADTRFIASRSATTRSVNFLASLTSRSFLDAALALISFVAALCSALTLASVLTDVSFIATALVTTEFAFLSEAASASRTS
jgi:hypothetical protein